MQSPFDRHLRQRGTFGLVLILSLPPAALAAYPRADYRAVFNEPGFHMAQGSATIIDERTIQVEHFTYDGTAPAVYFYLGAADTQQDFLNGIPIGPQLTTAYDDGSLQVQLPQGQTLDGYTAISVWCADVDVNFSSATFEPPYARGDLQTTINTPGLHSVNGTAGILDERSIHVGSFDYDGTAPLVYFYLAPKNEQASFLNDGIPIGPELDHAFSDASVIVKLPQGQSLDGYGALSVWCAEFDVNFSSGAFPRAVADFDIDGHVDADDRTLFEACATAPGIPYGANCADYDLDADGDIDQSDFAIVQQCYSGPDLPADVNCP